MRRILAPLAVVSLIASAGCAAPAPGESKFDSVEQLHAKLTAAGVPCDNLGTQKVEDQLEGGSCINGGYVIGIVVAKNRKLASRTQHMMSIEPNVGAPMAYGDNWFVYSTTPNVAPYSQMDRFAEILDGRSYKKS